MSCGSSGWQRNFLSLLEGRGCLAVKGPEIAAIECLRREDPIFTDGREMEAGCHDHVMDWTCV